MTTNIRPGAGSIRWPVPLVEAVSENAFSTETCADETGGPAAFLSEAMTFLLIWSLI